MNKEQMNQQYTQLVLQYGELSLRIKEIENKKIETERAIGKLVAEVLKMQAEEAQKAANPEPNVVPIKPVVEEVETEKGRS